MAAGNWVIYNDFIATSYKKKMDLTADTIKVILVTSASNAINKALVSAQYATVNNELTTANGYTAGGAAATSPTITGGGATATITFDTANVSWTGSGAGFTARAAVMYDDTSTNKDLIAYFLLDSTPADVTVASGVTMTITIANVFSAA
jgi:hypothetical protein